MIARAKYKKKKPQEPTAGELQEFRDFFAKMGVDFEEYFGGSNDTRQGVPAESSSRVSVSQAHLHFDADGKFLGLEDDEMGQWRPRKKK